MKSENGQWVQFFQKNKKRDNNNSSKAQSKPSRHTANLPTLLPWNLNEGTGGMKRSAMFLLWRNLRIRHMGKTAVVKGTGRWIERGKRTKKEAARDATQTRSSQTKTPSSLISLTLHPLATKKEQKTHIHTEREKN